MGYKLFWVKFSHAFAYFVVSFTSQMALLSNINFYFDLKTRLCLIDSSSWQARENIFIILRVITHWFLVLSNFFRVGMGPFDISTRVSWNKLLV